MPTAKELVTKARDAFKSGKTMSYKFRMKQLENLLKLFKENQKEITDALATDLRKSKMESQLTEILMTVNEIENAIANLKDWMEPEKVGKSLATLLDDAFIVSQPRGVVLVIGTWNYPIQISINPVVGAIAAGNCVIIKPSEVAPVSAKLIAKLIPKYLDQECYHVVLGGVEETTNLLKEKFDHIFYTGSTAVGKLIRDAANVHLTPVTLELGGKSPVYIDDSVDMKIAAKRILWGKCINSGQTCIAPDYLLCTPAVKDKFIAEAKEILNSWYGPNPEDSPDLCRIISDKHYKRLVDLLSTCKIAVGGQRNPSERFLAPTVVVDVTQNDPIMKEEIFGPILPILTVDSTFDAVKHLSNCDHPLTLYIFSNIKKFQQLLINSTSSGSVSVNETLLHFCIDTLPFGGVGPSGIGNYHGKFSFDTFSHKKSCLVKNLNPIMESIASSRYPPYSDSKLNFMTMLLKKRNGISIPYFSHLLLCCMGFAVGYAANRVLKEYFYKEH